jgi:hypothetical protein
MPTPHPNIVLVLSISHETQLPDPGTPEYSGRSCVAGTSWATNFVSLLSSSIPSHHRIWTERGKIGIHVDPLPVPLKKAGYRTVFIGPRDAEALAIQCGFDDIKIIGDGDGAREVARFIEHPDTTPVFVTCVVPTISEVWRDLVSRQAAFKAHPCIVLLSELVPPAWPAGEVMTKPDELSSPFTLCLHEARKNVDGSAHLWSIIDLAPSLLGLLGIKVPYTMVGKDLHPYWLGKPRKAIPFPRDRCLFEHGDGSKTTWNGRYLCTVHPGKETGEIFDLACYDGGNRNLWDDPASAAVKSRLLLELIWAQLDKECMPMPRIAGA